MKHVILAICVCAAFCAPALADIPPPPDVHEVPRPEPAEPPPEKSPGPDWPDLVPPALLGLAALAVVGFRRRAATAT